MGSMCTIYSSISRWQFLDQGHRLNTTGEPLLVVRYGIFDDDPSGPQDLEIYMRQSIVQKLMERTYHISVAAAQRRHLVLLDAHDTPIAPLKKDFIY